MRSTEPDMTPRLKVVAGIIEDGDGHVLLTQRPAHKHQGGCWEFPGGKVEAGESAHAALARELEEELGIAIGDSTPFMTIDHDYPDLSVRLMFRHVADWRGEPHPREQQPLARFGPQELSNLTFPAANKPVVTALRLPDQILVLPESLSADWQFRLIKAIEAGAGVVYARMSEPDPEMLISVSAVVKEAGAKLMVADDPALAERVGADVLHLTRHGMAAPLPEQWGGLRSMACHSQQQLDLAAHWKADLVTLSPINPTPTHTDSQPLGWEGFSSLATGRGFSVYALGGVSPADLMVARENGARGVAGIRAFW